MENPEYLMGRAIDLRDLSDLAKTTLVETYRQFPLEYLNEYHRRTMSAQEFEGGFDDENVVFSALRLQGHLVGFSKLVFGSRFHSIQAAKPVELQKLYVLKSCQGCGFGKLLFQKAWSEAVRRQSDTIWLAVQTENEKAIRFYEKIGFVAAGERMFTVEANGSTYSDKEIIYSVGLAGAEHYF